MTMSAHLGQLLKDLGSMALPWINFWLFPQKNSMNQTLSANFQTLQIMTLLCRWEHPGALGMMT
jgi:hypothetical protein